MKRAVFAALLLVTGLALAQGDRLGSRGEVTLSQQAGGPLVIEVTTQPEITGRREMMFYLFPRSRGSEQHTVRRVAPAVESGRYRLEVELPEDGPWGFSLRYGSGLDLYYGFVEQRIDSTADWQVRQLVTFRGGLEPGVPGYVQPLGFALFGLIAILTLVLIAVILRGLRFRGAGLG